MMSNSFFKGVYSLDTLEALTNNSGFIVNTHTSNLPGEHWIAVCVKTSEIEVFDPLGVYYPAKLVSHLHKSGHHRVHYSNLKAQDPQTTLCGNYCLIWLLE